MANSRREISEKKLTTGGIILFFLFFSMLYSTPPSPTLDDPKHLEPCIYQENFETNELNAWASYPLWQDTAFDPNLRPGRIVPGDPNISLLLRVTPYSHVDQYAGAQKELDLWFTPDSKISLKFYLKTEGKAEYLKIRLGAGKEGQIDFTFSDPPTNRWHEVTVTQKDLAAQNPGLAGRTIELKGLAVLAKFPNADPAMPIYFGLDDIVINAARSAEFVFLEPQTNKLAEWKPLIISRHYQRGEIFQVKGRWPFASERVLLRVSDFASRTKIVFQSRLKPTADGWILPPVKLDWPEGLYLGEIVAQTSGTETARTPFTLLVAPANLSGRHPRLWFDDRGLELARVRIGEERFRQLAESLSRSAREARENLPLENVIFDIDIFPKDEPTLGNVPRSIYAWFDRIRPWRTAVRQNSLAYALLDDQEAGLYAKGLIVRLCGFPIWLHPWFESRGQHIYYPVGELGMDVALAYDLVFGLLSEEERKIVRAGLRRNVVDGCHRSYVEDDLVTNNTSNWVAHITGGSLMSQAAIYGDGEDGASVEPYFTGAVFKLHDMIQKSIGRDGGYGESYGYCNFTMESLSKALPALINVFHIDLSGPIALTYQDIAWATLFDKKFFFYFGDSSGNLGPMTNWAWFLAKRSDPLLGWLYHFFKKEETLADLLYPTDQAPRHDPFGENPVRLFRDIGTTVFRSGWDKDDFVFVMRSGPFYNHQHLDQGTFWLADRGEVFIKERQGSTYYDDPIYQSHYTQPVAHSTILINRNPQSQRVGDPLRFIDGFADQASVDHFLDGTRAAFVSGDIGRLYWNKIRSLKRNVLYLKPRTVLMLDTVEPAENDAEVTILYQAGEFKDIHPDRTASAIHKGSQTLSIAHLWPENRDVRVEETPLYINTLKTSNPLVREGMLTVTTRTDSGPLVVANLLTTAAGKDVLTGSIEKRSGCVEGRMEDLFFIFSTRPGGIYKTPLWTSDALALTWKDEWRFAALCTTLFENGVPVLQSSEPLTCEILPKKMKGYLSRPGEISLRREKRPRSIVLGKKKLDKFIWEDKSRMLKLRLPAGESVLVFYD